MRRTPASRRGGDESPHFKDVRARETDAWPGGAVPEQRPIVTCRTGGQLSRAGPEVSSAMSGDRHSGNKREAVLFAFDEAYSADPYRVYSIVAGAAPQIASQF